jgi:two-component system, chemotaxis family, CheB/CheR fusion protein
MAIFPAGIQRETEVFLVNFEPAKVSDKDDEPARPSEQAEQELAATREHLQTMLEEMASANEEMQALTEEVQAANEELQASNEELEATNEELQATNEELISVNEESLTKSAELAAVNADFESVHNTLVFPLLVFDAHLYAKRANATAIRAFGLPGTVAGQHITRLRLPPALSVLKSVWRTPCWSSSPKITPCITKATTGGSISRRRPMQREHRKAWCWPSLITPT